MKKLFIIILATIVILTGVGVAEQFRAYENRIAILEAENAELQDTVYELDEEIQVLLDDMCYADWPVYDDTVEEDNGSGWSVLDWFKD